MTLIDKLKNIGDAIREKTGKTDLLTLDDMVTEIDNIEAGTDINEYFTQTVNSSSTSYPTWIRMVKKLPTSELKASITSLNRFFEMYTGTELDLSNFDTSKFTVMSSMFKNCMYLTNLVCSNKFVTNKVTDFSSIFYKVENLIDLEISSWDLSKATSIGSMFYNCSKLANLTFGINLGKGFTKTTENYSSYKLDLSYSNDLTHDSLMSVINNLYDLNLTYDVANGGTLYTQSLTLGSTNMAKLTADEITIATNKGWNVS